VDYFLGTTTKFADAATLDAVRQIVTSDTPDPVALRRVDFELAPFYCPGLPPDRAYSGHGVAAETSIAPGIPRRS
jgi:hypothetical protein